MHRPDATVLNEDGFPVAVIEVKSKAGTSPQWAAEFRRNLLAHGSRGWRAPYFIIATPDRFYLWDQADTSAPDALPTSVLDARVLLAPFYERMRIDPETLASSTFELIVDVFLSELLDPERLNEPVKKALDPELLDALRYGRVKHHLAA